MFFFLFIKPEYLKSFIDLNININLFSSSLFLMKLYFGEQHTDSDRALRAWVANIPGSFSSPLFWTAEAIKELDGISWRRIVIRIIGYYWLLVAISVY